MGVKKCATRRFRACRLVVVIDPGMLGSRGPKGFSQENCAEVSPLESLLQRAWLQSHRPKLQRRVSSAPVTDVSVGRRAWSQSSSPLLRGIISSQADDQEAPENFFVHKSRLDASTALISRFALPKLECHSMKTFIPKIVQWTYSVPSAGHALAQPSKSLVRFLSDSSESPSCISRHSSGFIESDYSSTGSVDFEGQTSSSEPSPSLYDGIFSSEDPEDAKPLPYEISAYQAMSKKIADLIGLESSVESEASDIIDYESSWAADSESYCTEAEMCVLEQSSAYQAMAREISELISPNPTVPDAGKAEVVISSGKYRPNEEMAALKMLEAYGAILSKHIRDVSISAGTSDSDSDSMFKHPDTETDTVLTYFDDDWKSYLQNINQNFTPTSNFDFNLLLCGAGGDSKVSAASSCGSLTELLYRYGYTLPLFNYFIAWFFTGP